MFAGKQGKVDGIGYGDVIGALVFAPNGASNPTTITGPLARFVSSITYSATGIYTITFTSEFVFANTPVFFVDQSFDVIANYFSANQIGAYNTTTRVLVVQTNRSGTGQQVAAGTGALVKIAMYAQDTGGK